MSESLSPNREKRRQSSGKSLAGMLAYGIAFIVGLPLLLAGWASALDRSLRLPSVDDAVTGRALVTVGAVLVASAVISLRRHGKGWPMSPFPPELFVSAGVYGLVAHPIYLGSVLLAAGLSIELRSAAGLLIVSPVLALACIAFVLGYESEATIRRFGHPSRRPLIHVPDDESAKPSRSDRLSVYFLVFLPWYLCVEGVNALGTSNDAHSAWLALDRIVPVVPWTEIVYFLTYPLALGVPLVAQSRRDLRSFVFRGWVAITVVVSFYLIVPVFCAPKPAPDGSIFSTALVWERSFEEPNTAFPSFHVIWTMLSIPFFMRRFSAPNWTGPVVVAAIAVSCVTTGMHAISDIVVGVAFGVILLRAETVWRLLIRACERLADSWKDVTLGRVRLINHGLYAGLAGLVGLVIVQALHPGHATAVVAVMIGSILGAGIWAQWIEGSSALLRPFGFYGGLIGATATIAVIGLVGGDWIGLMAAFAVAAPFIQAIGRVRCLLQGCCHGRATDPELGMRYRHPRSRVVSLAGLGGVPVHPTQLYSIVGNLLIGALLLRAWQAGLPLSFIVGGYLIMSSLERFVEEHLRGEPQTMISGGLRLYQWLAIASVVIGIAFQTLPSPGASSPSAPNAASLILALLASVVTYIAYGVDFPGSDRRFSRLA